MNPHDMRALFKDALTEPAPARRASTDDIVAAARRSHRRRRTAQAGAGALAAIAAAALAVGAPMVLGQDGGDTAGTPTAAESGEASEDPCAGSDEGATGEQIATAAMYDEALDAAVTDIGGTLGDSCDPSEENYDGFHYDPELRGYRFEEVATFLDTGERVTLTVDVLAPWGDPMDRAEELVGCGSIDGTCTWDAGLLMVEEQRTVVVDEDEPSSEEQIPYHSALLLDPDGGIVHVQMGVTGGPGTLSVTPEQLGEVAAAIQAVEAAPEVETPDEDTADEDTTGLDEELIGAFTDAVSSQLPEAVLDMEAPIAFADPEGSHYGEDGTAVAAVEAVVDGQAVTLFLQRTPIEAPGDGGAGRTAAEHYARCDEADDCEFSDVDETTARVHRTAGSGTELTSLEFRADDGLVLGVGVKVGEGEPPLDFAALDAIVAQIG